MNLETLAQDLSNKKQDALNKRIVASRADLALYDAETTLSDALCEAYGSNHDDVSIALKNHVVLCRWNRYACEYTMSLVSKVPNENA